MEREQYMEYLKSDQWKEKRQAVLERDGNKCMLCGDSDTVLNAHHNSYDNVGDEPLGDLITLCCECHKHYHLLHAQDDRGYHDLQSQYRTLLYDVCSAMEIVKTMPRRYLELTTYILDITVDAIVRPSLLDSDV
jgi:5-methylcytosine-specific restriction endonuclease McrA